VLLPYDNNEDSSSLGAWMVEIDHPIVVVLVDQVERLAVSLVALTNAAIGEASGSRDVTLSQWRVMVVLSAAPQRLRLRDLAQRIHVSTASASRVIHRLERKGLVTSTSDNDDARGIRIGLSDEGRRVRDAIVERRRELIAASLRDASFAAVAGLVLRDAADALGDWR
jgi:DNA-binding MarR family transcriptional regulator